MTRGRSVSRTTKIYIPKTFGSKTDTSSLLAVNFQHAHAETSVKLFVELSSMAKVEMKRCRDLCGMTFPDDLLHVDDEYFRGSWKCRSSRFLKTKMSCTAMLVVKRHDHVPLDFFFFERMTCALVESIQHSTVRLFCRPSFVFFTTVARAFRHVVSTVKVVKPRIIDFYLFSRRMCQPCCFVDVNLNRVASEYV